MRALNFSKRNIKELLRDPMMFIFSLGFPLVMLALMTVINRSVPDAVSLFEIETLSPGIAVFGLSFIALFSGTLLASDRETSFLLRLFSTPMSAADYVFGYILPVVLLSFCQTVICFAASFICGLKISAGVFLALFVSIPTAVMFIGIGLCLGCVATEKAVGGISSAIITVSTWLAGIWFDIALIGGVFETICKLLPFYHARESLYAAISGNYGDIPVHLAWVAGYAALFVIIAIVLFRRKMRE